MKNFIELYLFPLSIIVVIVVLSLFYLLWRSKKELETQHKRMEEKDEKIQWLREVSAENEHRHMTKDHENQKQIMALEHTVEILETQAKEGTKNQVVAKIEALEEKRARALERNGLVS